MLTRPTLPVAAFIALPLFAAGCASSGFEHLRQNVSDGGLSIAVEGLIRSDRVELYSVTVTVEGDPDAAFTQGECRLFEDVDGDGLFDPQIDRHRSIFNVDSYPTGSWRFGPLMGDVGDGQPWLATTVTDAQGNQRSHRFAIALE